jgi:DNA-binding LacI/PurR family transcriptional regulator
MAQELLSLPVSPTALLVGSDLLAAGALQAIRDPGLNVSEDVFTIGSTPTRLVKS